VLTAEPEFGGRKQPIDDQHIAVGAIVDEFCLAVWADDKERRHFALHDAEREFDVDLAAIVICG